MPINRRDEWDGLPVATSQISGEYFQKILNCDSSGAIVSPSGLVATSTLTTNAAVTVTSSEGQKIAANANRKGGFFFNLDSSVTVYYTYESGSGTPAASASTIPLLSWQYADFLLGRQGLIWTGPIRMYAASSVSVWVVEY